MKSRAFCLTVIVGLAFASLADISPSFADQIASPQASVVARALPVAAGALIGAAAGFFLLPLLVPATAVASTSAGVSVTASPLLGAVGAGIGGAIGYKFSP